MINSVKLRTEPSVRQTDAILTRIERELATRGVDATREGFGSMVFRMPPPWRAAHAGLLLPLRGGRVRVSAGAGERWRVRYELSFATLRALTLVLTAVVVAVGWSWPRLTLLSRLVVLWAAVYGAPWALAAFRFRKLVEGCAREVVERRKTPRAGSPAITGESGEVPAFPSPIDARSGGGGDGSASGTNSGGGGGAGGPGATT
jgi:hypothetical protein